MDRTLIYTCCDEKYSHFIPLFCAALLYSNDNIDIEIGVSNSKLTDKEEQALNYLRNKFKDSKILIRYNMFNVNYDKSRWENSVYNGISMGINTIRFISEPIIKDKYTYISDIDIISFDKNFYNIHINEMNKYNSIYSNIVRTNTVEKHLTGLHFVETEKYYPLNLEGIRFTKNDEQVLYDIVKNNIGINEHLVLRPIHGIHMSLNRSDPSGQISLGWGAAKYKEEWNNFKNTEIYINISKSFDSLIISLIEKLETYYKTI